MSAERASGRERSVPPLEGREVVLLGRLRCLSRAEAFERIAAAGGRLAEGLGPRTAWVVLADDGVPLAEDGALPGLLEEARARIERGEELALLDEHELLAHLGLDGSGAALRRLYTGAQLARILEVPPRRLAAWVRAGLIRPARTTRRLSYFEFRAVAQARALARLTALGVTPRRLRASLEALSRWWPGAQAPLAQLDALEGSAELCVRTSSGAVAEPSGQLRLAFPESEAIPELRAGAPAEDGGERPGPVAATPRLSDAWFQRALRLEHEERLEEAAQAYARALDPAHPRPEVAFNLGNALYAVHRLEEACAAFVLATELDPEYVEAWNNLGNALSLLGRHAAAREKFEHALALEPGYADAHFNLAETLAAGGDLEDARRHWRIYLQHDPDSPWAAEVRARLRRTDRREVLPAPPGPSAEPASTPPARRSPAPGPGAR